ncbi:hypothetical protein BuS5_00310 [Desulfosarcina sp. BuS5]|nr:hypothetical protein BuS5_00310 [Desulfosarcina sp. BuS5]
MINIDRHINNFTALSVGDILLVLSPNSILLQLIIYKVYSGRKLTI